MGQVKSKQSEIAYASVEAHLDRHNESAPNPERQEQVRAIEESLHAGERLIGPRVHGAIRVDHRMLRRHSSDPGPYGDIARLPVAWLTSLDLTAHAASLPRGTARTQRQDYRPGRHFGTR